MQTSRKSPRHSAPEPQAGISWSPWLDLAVSIGRAILGCERLIAEVALAPPPRAAGAKPQPSLVLIHSSARVIAGARRPASSLHLVYTAPPRRRRNARTA